MAAASMRVPYAERPEWADVAPLRFNDGNRVVAIQYLPEHAEALGYFRAVMRSGELSQRVLALTEDMIAFNQADYAAWHLRWQCVQALGPEQLPGELAFTHRVMLESAKNYQLWHHRRLCALQLGPAQAVAEMEFTREALDFDEKNYHAWAHRQAIVKMSGAWEDELAYCVEMLGRDVRNNSAWNQRMFVLQSMPQPKTDAWLRTELEYVASQIQLAPRNEASWTFLAGLFSCLQPWASQPYALARWPEVDTICREALQDCASCGPALELLAQYYEGLAVLAAAQAQRPGADDEAREEAKASAAVAVGTARVLLDEAGIADPMRLPYWNHRHACVTSRVAAPAGASLGTAATG